MKEEDKRMKKIITPIALLLIFLCSYAMADQSDLPRITVTGTAKKMVVPDRMTWSISVHNKGLVLKDVAARHASLVGDILRFLKEIKIEEDHIQTSRMQFSENWVYRNNTRLKEGYFAYTDISFKLTDMDAYNPIWMGLAEKRDVSVRNVAFEISDRTSYQDDARKEALLAAKEKAEAMAKVLGTDIGEPLLIAEDLSVSEPHWRKEAHSNVLSFAEQAGSNKRSVAPGQIPIFVRIKVDFRLINVND